MIQLFDNAKISENVEIGEFSVIGKSSRPRFNSYLSKVVYSTDQRKPTIISAGCYIGVHVLIEEGVEIGQNCIIPNFACKPKQTNYILIVQMVVV